jgi:alanine racemase
MNAEIGPESVPASPGPESLPAGMLAAAVVNLDAIRHNVEVLDARTGSAAVMAVVKADAYGHGLVPCARAALAGGASWLGVARLAEALTLRAAGIDVPTLCWLTVPGDDFAAGVRAGVDIGIGAAWALTEVASAAQQAGKKARVHLKIDTGMNRNGVAVEDWPHVVDTALKFQAEGWLQVVGGFSHFAYSDIPDHPSVVAQSEAFAAAIDLAERKGARFEVRHLANSAAALTNPGTHYDLVRAGIATYGLSPVPDLSSARELGLEAAMTLYGRVANVKRVGAGQGVSYWHTYVTKAPTTLAVIPLGYSDGLPRQAGNAGPVQLAGLRRPVAGQICMDQIVVDLQTQDSALQAGDVAVLFGGAPGQPIADDWATAAGTISYEIVARVGAMVTRIYTGTAGRGSGTSELGTPKPGTIDG